MAGELEPSKLFDFGLLSLIGGVATAIISGLGGFYAASRNHKSDLYRATNEASVDLIELLSARVSRLEKKADHLDLVLDVMRDRENILVTAMRAGGVPVPQLPPIPAENP